ncbi:MAG: ABC transporter ATP-binding protein [Clostridia bacterium]|nr:ABC transporter ATP-binding protein [Clostridia bacterium]
MLLEVNHVVKKYPNGTIANDDISLTVDSGEVFGLLGPNGAGKTTLISQIIGLSAPTSGSIHINGIDIVKNPAYARKVCSFQPQSQVPIDGLSPLQAIEIIGRLRGGKKNDVKKKACELIEKLQITPWATKSGEKLSGGVRRLVAFCMAVVVPGKIVILDEPTNDVDPLRRRLLWGEVRSIADEGNTVLLVTHNVLEAERSVDRLAIINGSRLLKVGTPAAFKEYDSENLTLELILEPSQEIMELPSFIFKPHRAGRRLRTYVKSQDLTETVGWAQALQREGIVEEFFIGPINLEDAYMQMTADHSVENSQSDLV